MTDSNSVIIRHFNNDDLIYIAEIEALSINPPWSHKAICDFAKSSTGRILTALENEKVLGYITYSVVLDEVQIANVAVHPDYRRCGVANRLLSTLYEEAKCSDMSLITLEVRKTNYPAIRLYEKCGYEEVGIRKNYYKNPTEDAILMNLNI